MAEQPKHPDLPQAPNKAKRFVWVPQLKTYGSADPWGHRKGEPRTFAVLWCVYLLGASLATILSVEESWPPSSDQYEFPARVLMTLMLFGITVMWPAIRLCQATPRNPPGASLADWVVIVLPAQVLIWPMMLMLSWPLSVTAWLALAAASWGTVSMTAVAWGVSSNANANRRITAMSLCLAFSLAGGLVGIAWASITADAPPRWVWAWNALTGVWIVTEPESALSTLAPSRLMWAGACVPGAISIGLWLALWMHTPSHQIQKHPPSNA